MQFDTPVNVNDSSYERLLLQGSLPAVGVFWSSQTTSRDQLNLVLDQVASAYAGKALIVKLDLAEASRAQAQFSVDSSPQFLFFRDGKLIARAKGMPSVEALEPWMHYLLGEGPRPVTRRPTQTEPPSGGHPVVVTDSDFDQVVLSARTPALVDFWASWCGPCRMVAPIVESLAGEFGGRAVIAKVDVDANPRTAQRYGVQSIPTIIYFQNGREVDRVVGVQQIEILRQKLQGLI
ncbi:MAG: thioredoxin [Chloroflexi bacterium]|nr:thioredoxin [Chloroflexota bacterium]